MCCSAKRDGYHTYINARFCFWSRAGRLWGLRFPYVSLSKDACNVRRECFGDSVILACANEINHAEMEIRV